MVFSANEYQVARSVPLLLDMAGEEITSCIAASDPEVDLKRKACGVGTDGISQYDPLTDECVDTRRRQIIIADNPLSVRCPAGYKVDGPASQPNGGCYDGQMQWRGRQVEWVTREEANKWCPTPYISAPMPDGQPLYNCPAFSVEIGGVAEPDLCVYSYSLGMDFSEVRPAVKCVEIR